MRVLLAARDGRTDTLWLHFAAGALTVETAPLALNGEGVLTARFERPAEAGSMPTLVAFVQERNGGEILQAVALPLADCVR